MFKSLFLSGEGRLWITLWYFSISRHHDTAVEHRSCSWFRRHFTRLWENDYFITLICVVPYVVAISYSVQQLLIKITMIDFVTEKDIYSFNLAEWVGFIGFVNQTVGCFDFYPSALAQLFMYAFGSHDARLSSKECQTACWYMKLIAQKCQSPKNKVSGQGGRKAVVCVLATLSAASLQKLLQCRRAAHNVENAKEKRHEVYKALMLDDVSEKYLASLAAMEELPKKRADRDKHAIRQCKDHAIDCNRKRIEHFEKERKKLLMEQERDAPIFCKGSEVAKSTLLHLAAEVQFFIEDLESMQGEVKEVFSDFSDSDVETHEDNGEKCYKDGFCCLQPVSRGASRSRDLESRGASGCCPPKDSLSFEEGEEEDGPIDEEEKKRGPSLVGFLCEDADESDSETARLSRASSR